jgi:hypothetical protein
MAGKPQLLEIVCDAPPYPVVRVCRQIGLECPEDVRWCRADHFLEQIGHGPPVRTGTGWNELIELLGPQCPKCSCGGRVPPLSGYHILSSRGDGGLYYFGQCRRCKTVYWDRA